MPALNPSPTEAYCPATFRDRGLAIPFTSPMLAGARIREEKQGDLEILIPDLAGGRGAYVLSWPTVCDRCHPTMHDIVLFKRISALKDPDPVKIRAAAWAVAGEGMAGRLARIAAEAADARDRAERRRARLLLTTRLLRQTEPADAPIIRSEHGSEALEQRLRAVLDRLGPSFGQSGGHLADALASIVEAYAPIGVAQDETEPRVMRQIERLRLTGDEMVEALASAPVNDISRLGASVLGTLRVAAEFARDLMDDAQKLLGDPQTLLKQWFATPQAIRGLALRPEWVLDGWERVCLLFLTAGSRADQHAALIEMAQMMPTLPPEINTWAKARRSREGLEAACRVISQDDTWRSGGAGIAFIGRNEKLRAMTL